MDGITARHCYFYLRDSRCMMTDEECSEWNLSWLTDAARAFMRAAYLGQRQDMKAMNFVKIVKDCGTDEEYAYARHLETALTFILLNDSDGAIVIAKEVISLAQSLGDKELEGDALTGLSTIYEAMGETTTAAAYEREASEVRAAATETIR